MKNVWKSVVLLIMCISLTGCMKYNINITVNKDMTSETSMELLVEDSFLEAMNMTSDEFYESFEEEYLDSDDLKNATISQINDEGWSGVSVTGLTLEDSMSTAISEEKIDDVDSIVVTIPISDIKAVVNFSDYGYSLDDLKEAGMEITLNITMPAKVSSNFGEINDKTVSIDLLELMYNDSDEENIVISSAIPNNTMLYIAVGAIAVVVIAAGIYIFMKRKKKI